MTHKMPTGGKHAPCIDHVPHTYTSNGWLCVNDEPGRAEAMVEFADHLAEVAARHRLAEADRPSAVETVKARKLAAEIAKSIPNGWGRISDCLADHHCDWTGDHDKIRVQYIVANPVGRDFHSACIACAWTAPSRPGERFNDGPDYRTAEYAPLIGPYLAELGAGVRPILPADAFTPRTDPGRIEPGARVKVAAIVKEAPVQTVKPQTVKARKTSTRHIHRTAEGEAVYIGDTCAECGHSPIGQDAAYVSAVPESRIITPGRSSVPVAELVAQMGPDIAERAAAFVLEHPAPFALPDPIAPAHKCAIGPDGERCLKHPRSIAEPSRPEPIPARDINAQNRADMALALRIDAKNRALAATVPTLAILPDVRATDDRPRCARCGQTFRKSGTGAAWHLVNRPDCAAEYRRASA